ncbi:plexin-B-like isoform X2 [Ptychodera flava]|uniref:plexin-B-like isoform X2 n=1 Tax=Ptychodera flava TaxID=63121 RepID=UPI00396A7107
MVLAVICLLVLGSLCGGVEASIYHLSNFSDEFSRGLNHLLVHKTGNVYVGGVNRIYKLNGELELQFNVSTGPLNNAVNGLTDNNNKILLLDFVDDTLVVCGSYRGVCEIRSTVDLSILWSKDVHVLADSDDASTVGTIASGYNDEPMLYVGTTKTESRYGGPLVSGRQIRVQNLFETFDSNTQVKLRSTGNRATFRVKYILAFSYGHFVYFLNTQPSEAQAKNSRLKSKIARVCQNDNLNGFPSFTEITLACTDDDDYVLQTAYLSSTGTDLVEQFPVSDQEAILFTVFTKYDQSTASVVCAYRMASINDAFSEAVRKCMEDGHGAKSMYTIPYLQGTCGPHIKYHKSSECNPELHSYANYDVSPVSAEAIAVYSDIMVTSIAVTTTGRHTILFLGTSNGNLMKLHVSRHQSHTYENISVDDGFHRVLPDMDFDASFQHIYVPTSKEIYKLKVADCSQYTSCESCFASRDPYCGWCTLESRCSLLPDCAHSDENSRWLNAFSDKPACVNMSDIQPADSLPITTIFQIAVTITALPELEPSHRYTCIFDDAVVVVAEKNGSQLICNTPQSDQRPEIPKWTDHVTVFLGVASTETNTSFVSAELHYYNCSSHKSCTDCVTSNWACNWCVNEHRCSHFLDRCSLDVQCNTVFGIKNDFNESDTKGQSFCPQLDLQDGQVLIPVNVAREIQVKTLNFYQLKYAYTNEVQEMDVSLSVIVDGHSVDDIYGYRVTLYDCSVHRQDPNTCLSDLTTRLALQCGWCEDSGTCQVKELCELYHWLPYGKKVNYSRQVVSILKRSNTGSNQDYQETATWSPGLTTAVVVTIVCSLIAFIIAVIICVVCRIRMKYIDRRFQLAADVLHIMEMNVKRTTENRYPLLGYSRYAANMLFGGQTYGQALTAGRKHKNYDFDRLEEFYSLLTDKTFCLTFIRTMENSQDMSLKDRTLVASLLTVVLHNEYHMMYLTDVLKAVLADAAKDRRQPHRLGSGLTRKGTIMEILLFNWFALTLYTFTKVVIGKSLFMLVTALEEKNSHISTISDTDSHDHLNDDAVKWIIRSLVTKLLTVERQQHYMFPPPIKYMFDYLDILTDQYGMGDRKEADTLKADSLLSTLWVVMIRCPHFVFDVKLTKAVHGNLDVVAEMFQDICSQNKISPERRNAADVAMFRSTLETYFDNIKSLPTVHNDTFRQFLMQNCRKLEGALDRNNSLDELFKFVIINKDKLIYDLERDAKSRAARHAARVEHLTASEHVQKSEEIQVTEQEEKSTFAYVNFIPLLKEHDALSKSESHEGLLLQIFGKGSPELYQPLQLESQSEYKSLEIGQKQNRRKKTPTKYTYEVYEVKKTTQRAPYENV